jgi:hypothetical protein
MAGATAAAHFPAWGCSTGRLSARDASSANLLGPADLREAFAVLRAGLEEPQLFARYRQREHAAVDSQDARFTLAIDELVILSGRGQGLRQEIALHNPLRDELISAARQLANGEAAGRRSNAGPAPAAVEPWSALVDSTRALFASAVEHGGSRVIYRSAFRERTADRTTILDRHQDRELLGERHRVGVAMLAWTGDSIASESIERGVAGFRPPNFKSDELRELAQGVLTHLHSRGAPEGNRIVVFSPEASAAIVHRCIAVPHFAGIPLGRLASSLRIYSDPLANGFAHYERDDRGAPATRFELLGESGLRPTAEARGHSRFDEHGRLHTGPANLFLVGGENTIEDQIAGIDRGVIVHSPSHASFDRRAHAVTVIANRGDEISKGRLTGRRFGRLLIRLPIDRLLRETLGVTRATRTSLFLRDGVASSCAAPHWAIASGCEAV